MEQAVAYLRVSTERQGRSGLGLEAQRDIIARFAQGEGVEIVGEFVEVETGKGADALGGRPHPFVSSPPVLRHPRRGL